MNKTLINVGLRYNGIYLNVNRNSIDMRSKTTAHIIAFVSRLQENGFCVSEELLHAFNKISTDTLIEITDSIDEATGVKLNWTPLVKNWNIPTGETYTDHLITLFANIYKDDVQNGTILPCGHFIPENTFPVERYNGCPFCSTPFKTSNFIYKGQGSRLKELRLLTDKDMKIIFESLLTSATPLDATQKDSLEQLLQIYDLPDTNIKMKETAMLAIKLLVRHNKQEQAIKLLKTPTDILRYLWFEKTGYIQIIEPKTLVAHARKLYHHIWGPLDKSSDAANSMKQRLMLKYDRKSCLRVATWMNAIPMTAQQAAANMNPKREMWVRMIHSLRLGEYSRKKGMEHLREILDVFYKQDYTTWHGNLDTARQDKDLPRTLSLLKERPGLFARYLFATILRFGTDEVLKAFDEVSDKLPARLLLSLGNAADAYFDPNQPRLARPITGGTHKLESNKLLSLYNEEERKKILDAIKSIYTNSMIRRFKAIPSKNKSVFIDRRLYNIPVSVGDRATTIHDISCALTGTRFPIQGDTIRLFMQWGKGLHAQHLDMDLSARISFLNGKTEECAYYNLTCIGAKHSGDIRSIPEMTGTAEYIELSIPELEKANARYITFTCNAYSVGALSPNLVVGWMDSAYPMAISDETGVAYDPSCVQHSVRISEGNLTKGLVFGILNVEKHEIVWLEMPFTAQTLRGADAQAVETLLKKLESKLSIGELLELKARAQESVLTENEENADETYTYEWALNPAEVTKLLDI
ncbi:hypothetical protein [Xylanibacter muris]|uniref:Prokaryotic RING finger family 4 n=1 Tax=Xylanibacter muris TaxID=2736290 RepID=A0ABX2ANA7_9BACT|nr:hypothetical protein [Xylanibacter muris]NPD92688.1 hypothetical protein [Xylanibacter muris]